MKFPDVPEQSNIRVYFYRAFDIMRNGATLGLLYDNRLRYLEITRNLKISVKCWV